MRGNQNTYEIFLLRKIKTDQACLSNYQFTGNTMDRETRKVTLLGYIQQNIGFGEWYKTDNFLWQIIFNSKKKDQEGENNRLKKKQFQCVNSNKLGKKTELWDHQGKVILS